MKIEASSAGNSNNKVDILFTDNHHLQTCDKRTLITLPILPYKMLNKMTWAEGSKYLTSFTDP